MRLIQPTVRNIVRIVGQPSFIEAYDHVDLPEADGLYREVDRGHRRQGEEGRGARHALRPGDGRGFRDEDGDRGLDAEAELLSEQATLAKARKVDVTVARAD